MVTKPENLFLSWVFLAVTPCCEYSAQNPSQKAPQAIAPPLFLLQKYAPLLSRFFYLLSSLKTRSFSLLAPLSSPSFPLFSFFFPAAASPQNISNGLPKAKPLPSVTACPESSCQQPRYLPPLCQTTSSCTTEYAPHIFLF